MQLTDEPTVPPMLAEAEPWRQLAVAAAVVARMQPNFALFCELSGHPGNPVYAGQLGLVWDYAAGINTRIDFDRQQAKLEAITPDPAQWDMYGVWPALDATVALAALLSCCERFEPVEIATVFEVSRATIGGFLDARGEEYSGHHPLFVREADFIERILAVALSPDGSRKQRVAAVRRAATAETATGSNIGLAVE